MALPEAPRSGALLENRLCDLLILCVSHFNPIHSGLLRGEVVVVFVRNSVQ